MFKLHSIKITNFRSYQGTHSFEFPEVFGLYYLTGKNLTDDIGENGAGKSTFLDAITWCLYGRTTRGLKSGDILPWGATGGTSVALDLTVGHRFIVTRTQKPNNLTLNDKPVDQEELQKTLRLNFDSFINSVLRPQFGDSFFDLTPSAKLALFSNIMELDFWLKRSEMAAELSRELEAEIQQLEKELVETRTKFDLYQMSIEEMEAYGATFEMEKMKEIDEIQEKIKALSSEVIASGKDLTGLKADQAELLIKLKETLLEVKHQERLREVWIEKVQKYTKDKTRYQTTLDHFTKQYNDFLHMGGVCLCCGRAITPQYASSHATSIKLEIKTYESKVVAADEDRQMAMKQLIKAKGEVEKWENEANDLRGELSKLSIEITKLESTAKATTKEIGVCKDTVLKKRAEKNPYIEAIDQKKSALKKAQDKILSLTKDLKEVQAEHSATVFWIKGFKRIRLFTIEQTFKTLELEVNNCLAQLGLPNWQITFDIERENKKGGLTKGFVVFIKSPKNKEPVKWECWSGGETQRLQLAGSLGLGNLIMQQAGLTNSVEFYDEFSQHLSPKGVQDTLDLLKERALTDEKTIFVIDHNSYDRGNFDGVYLISKDSEGSKINGPL